MTRITASVRVENLSDRAAADEGRLAVADIRAVVVTDAVVDPGAGCFSMPATLLAELGLQHLRSEAVRVFGTARVTIQGRDCPVDILELPDGCPVVIGPVTLHALDLVEDRGQHALVGNPAHGGEHVIELY